MMNRIVSLRAVCLTTLFVAALGGVTSINTEAGAASIPDSVSTSMDAGPSVTMTDVDAADIAAPACEAYGCDYSYVKPDGSAGVLTTDCSPACDCPAKPGHTLFHKRCYLTGGDGGGDEDVAPVH